MAITYSNTFINHDNFAIEGILKSGVEINTETVSGQYEALKRCSILQEVVLLRANAFGNLRVWAKDKYMRKVYNKTVIEDIEKINYFNTQQDYFTFNNHVEIYAATFGACFIHKKKLLGIDKYEYYVIPNWLIRPKNRYGNDVFYYQDVDYYSVYVFNGYLELPKSEIIIVKDNSFNFQNQGYGSRLSSLKDPVSLLIAMGEMSTQLIADGGARGIIGQGARDIDMMISPFLTSEKKEIQSELKKYGGLKDQFKYIVTKGTASYIPLTSRIVDMDLGTLDQMAVLKIFGAYGIPKIYANKEPRFKAAPEGRKEFYTGTITPEANIRHNFWLKEKGIPKREWDYVIDYTHLDFYQEMLQQSASAQLNASTALKNAVETGFMTKEEAKGEFEYYLNR